VLRPSRSMIVTRSYIRVYALNRMYSILPSIFESMPCNSNLTSVVEDDSWKRPNLSKTDATEIVGSPEQSNKRGINFIGIDAAAALAMTSLEALSRSNHYE